MVFRATEFDKFLYYLYYLKLVP